MNYPENLDVAGRPLKEVSMAANKENLTMEQKRWIVDKLRKQESGEWDLADRGMLKEILHLPEIQHIETVSLPHSHSHGLKIELSKDNNLSPYELCIKLFGTEKNSALENKIFSQYKFIILDNIYIKEKPIAHSLHTRENKPQILHHDILTTEHDFVFSLYHPDVTKDKPTSRQATTYLSDALEYYPRVFEYYSKWFKDMKDQGGETAIDDPKIKQLYHKLDLIDAEGSLGGDENDYSYYWQERIAKTWNKPIEDPEVLLVTAIMSSGSAAVVFEKFVKEYDQYIYKHAWQPNQLVVMHNNLLVHGRGVIPEDSPTGYNLDPEREQGLTQYDMSELQQLGSPRKTFAAAA